MREQSQLSDMRAAIRGDLERAKARRESAPEPLPDRLPPPTTEAKIVLTPPRPQEAEPVAETAPEPEVPFVPEPAAETAPESEEVESLRPEVSETVPPEPVAGAAKPGFFARLFGR